MDYTMEYVHDPNYPSNNSPNRQRQCDSNAPSYNYHYSSPLPRLNHYHQQPYDPVHDQSNYNHNHAPHIHGQNNGYQQGGGYGGNAFSQPFQGGMPAMPMMPQIQHMPFMPLPHVDYMSRNNNYTQFSQGSTYQMPSFGAPAQAIPLQNAPFFGSPTRLPMTNNMSQRQYHRHTGREPRHNVTPLPARIPDPEYLRWSQAPRSQWTATPSVNTVPSDGASTVSSSEGNNGDEVDQNIPPTTNERSQARPINISRTPQHRVRLGRVPARTTELSSSDEEFEAEILRYSRYQRHQNAEVLAAMRQYSAAPAKPKISQAALDSLIPVTEKELEAEGEEKACIICYNDFHVSNPEGVIEKPFRLPKCRHVFGDICIKQWFEDNTTCPYCRDKLPVEVVDHRSRMEDALYQVHALRVRQARLSRERNEIRNSQNDLRNARAHNRTSDGSSRYASIIDDLFDADIPESPRRNQRQARGPPSHRGLDIGRSNIPQRGGYSSSGEPAASSANALTPSTDNSGTSSIAQQASPAVAVGSVSSRPRLSGFDMHGSGERRYSNEDMNRLVNTRDSLHRGDSTPLSISPPSSLSNGPTSPVGNAVFGPSERQVAMGSPRPIPQGLPNDYAQYQTSWVGSINGSSP